MNVKMWKKNRAMRPNFMNEGVEDDIRREEMREFARHREVVSSEDEDRRDAIAQGRAAATDAARDTTADVVADRNKVLSAIYEQAQYIYNARLGEPGESINYELESENSFVHRNANNNDYSSMFVEIKVLDVKPDFRYLADESEILENVTAFDKSANKSKLFESKMNEAEESKSFLQMKQFMDPETIAKICAVMPGDAGAEKFVLVEIPDGGIQDTIIPQLRSVL